MAVVIPKIRLIVFLCVGMAVLISGPANSGSKYRAPKPVSDQVVVIDAYEKNPVDWLMLKKNSNLRAFIGKASDGLAPPWACPKGDNAARTLCKKTFQNYHLKKELYHTRKTMAKAMGLKWGAYHLGRPGNPVQQAYHFLQFADPQPDELIALDIEHDDPDKWISFADAEKFARYIHARIGRYPVLYTNHDTARRIAAQRDKYPLLSRLPLWYARFKSDIRGVFPMGNWDSYALWQFSARPNCNTRRCLYRIKGTQSDIDVNATGMTNAQFDAAWPFDGLVPQKPFEQPEELLIVEAKPETKTVASLEVEATDQKASRNKDKPIVQVKALVKQASAAQTGFVTDNAGKSEKPVRKILPRYKVGLSFENDDGETVKLATVAVPTARLREDTEETVPAQVEVQLVAVVNEKPHKGDNKSSTFASVERVSVSDLLPQNQLAREAESKTEEVSLLSVSEELGTSYGSSKYGYVHALPNKGGTHHSNQRYLR